MLERCVFFKLNIWERLNPDDQYGWAMLKEENITNLKLITNGKPIANRRKKRKKERKRK